MILNTFHNRSLLTYIGVLVPRCWALAWNEEKDSPTLKIEVWGRAQKNRNFFRLVRQKYLKKFAIHAQCHGWNLKCFSFFSFSIDDDGHEKSERSRKKSVQSSNSTSCVRFLAAFGNRPAMAWITRTFYSHLVSLFTADDHESDVFISQEGKMISISSAPFKSIHSPQTSRKIRAVTVRHWVVNLDREIRQIFDRIYFFATRKRGWMSGVTWRMLSFAGMNMKPSETNFSP